MTKSATTKSATQQARLLTDADVSAVASYVTERTGTVLGESQVPALRDFLQARFMALGVTSAKAYIDKLGEPAEFAALVDSLTVAETFFFRFEAQLESFRKVLLPRALDRARQHGRKARLWSAGCCTGEEPYTLALIAAEAGVLDEVEILGTDINAGYLEKAMRGLYGKRALQNVTDELKGKYFKPQSDGMVLAESIRRVVTFRCLNLAEEGYPSFLNGTSDVDVIFCRNVLIYIEPQRARAILDRFARCLVDGGTLALGHSEMCPTTATLVVERLGDVFFCRKGKARPRAQSAGQGKVLPMPERRAPATAAAEPAAGPAPATSTPAASPDHSSGGAPEQLLRRAEQLAEQGNSDEALKAARQVLQVAPLESRAYYLIGLLEMADPNKAREAFKKAVYLDPEHLLARLHLARSAERTGNEAEAVREFRETARLASAKPPEDILDSREGISYGLLVLICQRAIELLERKRA